VRQKTTRIVLQRLLILNVIRAKSGVSSVLRSLMITDISSFADLISYALRNHTANIKMALQLGK
jgi:hypothetical protein